VMADKGFITECFMLTNRLGQLHKPAIYRSRALPQETLGQVLVQGSRRMGTKRPGA
jgi:hypothetical protein